MTERTLVYCITNPNFTIYHRAAVGGLAATVEAWGDNRPEGIGADVTSEGVTLTFAEGITKQEALRRLLAASFPPTQKGLISLPGHRIPDGDNNLDLRAAIHNALCQTFLQHPKMRPGEKTAHRVLLSSVDNNQSEAWTTYKDVTAYAHQRAQGTGLLEHKSPQGELPSVATIPQSMLPGATGGAASLDATTKEVLLLLYLMVGCQVFQVVPRRKDDGVRACIVVPDVRDPKGYARLLGELMMEGPQAVRSSVEVCTAPGRTLGGVEDAGLRFLLDLLQSDGAADDDAVAGCQVIAMGKVAWDGNQINRNMSIALQPPTKYAELEVFKAARTFLGSTRVIPKKDGDSFLVPKSPVPALVARNLARGERFYMGFAELVATRKDFMQQLYSRKGLIEMKDRISDEDDRAVIETFHAAWRSRMAQLFERANRDALNGERLVEVEQERLRNDLLRAKTAEELADRFLRLCAEATRGRPLTALRERQDRVRPILFQHKHLERLRSLLLFAMLTYEGKKDSAGGDADDRKDTEKGN